MILILLLMYLMLVLGAYISLLNALALWRNLRGGKYSSPIPLIGGILMWLALAFLLADTPYAPYAGCVALLDYGTGGFFLGMAWLAVTGIRQRFLSSPKK